MDLSSLAGSAKEAKSRGDKFYFTGKPCKRGHTEKRYANGSRCTACAAISGAEWIAANSEKQKQSIINWKKKNRDKYLRQKAEWQSKNRHRYRQKLKEWKEKNRAHINKSVRVRRQNDFAYSLSCRLRSRITGAIQRMGYPKKCKTSQMLGCSWDCFKSHIERQFKKGMSWGNRPEWHIDHIVPLASARSEEEIVALNHYTNLRPMWAKDNQSKGAKQEHLI